MGFAEKLTKIRKQKGLSQGELAKTIGVTAAHLSRLENNRYQPSVDVLKKLADTLQVSTDYLLNDVDDEPKEIRIQDQSFANKIRLLDSLEGKDKEAIEHIIDSIVTKKKILHLLTENEETLAAKR
jgi:transcriptional regulator with XRE-family HTH domain